MLSSSRLETVACRFEPVVKDLRSFLKDNGVAYGFPEHLLAFTEHLTDDEALRDAVSAKLHTVVSRVPETTSHGDLVEVLLLSIGGFAIDEDTPPMQKAERTLSRLVGEVMTSPHTILLGPPALAPLPTPPPLMAPPLALLQVLEGPSPEALPVLAPSPDVLPVLAPITNLLTQPTSTKPLGSSTRVTPGRWPIFATGLLARLPKPPAASSAFAWTQPPRYVWAALVCGALFPTGMYLISQPHAAPPYPLHHRATMNHPAEPLQQGAKPQEPARSTDLDRQTDEDLASIAALGFGTNAGQPQVAFDHFRRLRARGKTTSSSTPIALPPAASSAVADNLIPRETDMPGRDLGSLAPVSSSPQAVQAVFPPKP